MVFKAPGCDGCRIRVYSATWGEGDEVDLWQSKRKKVDDGRVRFAVPAGQTRGLSVSVSSPWEGRTNYVTHVAFKYGKTKTGEVITVEAVDGSDTTGTMAFARVTPPAMVRMVRAHDGVLGAQDEFICGKR